MACKNYDGDLPSSCQTAEEPPGSGTTVTTPAVTTPVVTTPAGGSTQPITTESPGDNSTTAKPPGGSGETPVISFFILFVSLFISRFM